MRNRYFSLLKNEETKEADVNIFGDITSWDWEEFGEISAHTLSKQLEELGDVNVINVHISSYGGEVKEGLAIYNALKNHNAKIKTYCDGFACSIASVIFMAGEERIMSKSSLLMIHNAWKYVAGNANDLRKEADDLDKITQASVNAYMECINITEEELKEKLDAETWLTYDEALEMNFATSVVGESNKENASQSVKQSLINMIREFKAKQEEQDDEVNIDIDDENLDEDNTEDLNQEQDDNNNVDNNTEDETSGEDNTDSDSTEDDNKNEYEKANERMVSFFSAMIGGMKE